jgi:hypothetical protein
MSTRQVELLPLLLLATTSGTMIVGSICSRTCCTHIGSISGKYLVPDRTHISKENFSPLFSLGCFNVHVAELVADCSHGLVSTYSVTSCHLGLGRRLGVAFGVVVERKRKKTVVCIRGGC